jgi:hypothetical protein
VETAQSKFKAIFPGGLSIIFRTEANPMDFELSRDCSISQQAGLGINMVHHDLGESRKEGKSVWKFY